MDKLIEAEPGTRKLQRTLSLGDVLAYGLLYFVPIAPVAVFGVVFNMSGGMVALTYVIAAIAMIFSAISYSEMARSIPLSGSVYSYVSAGANPFFGFLAGWAILLDYLLLPALLAVLGAASLEPLFPSIDKSIWVIAFVVLPLMVNLRGTTVNLAFGKVLLLIQLAVMAIFFAFAVGKIADGQVTVESLIAPFYNTRAFTLAAAFGAVPVAAFSYIGFDAISTLNEEAKGGGKTVSKATMLLLYMVTFLFVAQVYLAAVFVPVNSSFVGETADSAFYIVGAKVVGHWFLPVITLTNAVVALLANALISQATTSKVVYCMARDGRLPAVLNRLSSRNVPDRALYAVGALSLLIGLLMVNRIEMIVTMVTFGALCAYIMIHVTVIIYFKPRSEFSLIKHMISPIVGIVLLAYALWSANIHAQILGVVWMTIGALIAIVLSRQNKLGSVTFEL